MIYTVTFNPALDYVLQVPHFRPGHTNRAAAEELQVGGKGINVSLVLKALGVESTALGFLAGDTGELLRRRLEVLGVRTDFVPLPSGFTRINVKLKSDGETELNGRGPDIPQASLDALLAKLDHLAAGDTLVLAGSIPQSLPHDVYEHTLVRLDGKGVRSVVDATGPLLDRVLPYHPFLVKPNHLELGELVGRELDPLDRKGLTAAARTLQGRGARNVLVSLAQHGALLCAEDGQVYTQGAAVGELKNSVGAGDSMVAGFLAGFDRGGFPEALLLGSAAGGATAFSPRLATGAEIERIYRQLSERKMSIL